MCKEFPRVTRIYPHSTAAVVSCTRSSTELQESTHILQQLLYHVQGVPLSYKNLPTFYSSCCIMYKEFPRVTRIYPHSTAAVLSHTRSSKCYKNLSTFYSSCFITYEKFKVLQESIHILQQLFYHIREVPCATRVYLHSSSP